MKRLIFIVEGETEEEFVNTILVPFFNENNFYNIQCFKIKHSKGGVSKYSHIREDILNTIYESDVVVTTMIDFYQLPHDTPGFTESEKISSHQDRVCFIENAMKEELERDQKRNFPCFIPYLQLHEFEALTFSSDRGFKELFEKSEADFPQLESIISQFPNPEDINDRPETAPSKRLLKAIKGYDKITYGTEITRAIGMPTLLKKCPHFHHWIEKLMNAVR